MGLRQWFAQLLSRGAPDEEPEALVELDWVPLAEGPMLVTRLQHAGIKAVGFEAYDPATGAHSRMRIMVRRADAVEAMQRLDELRS